MANACEFSSEKLDGHPTRRANALTPLVTLNCPSQPPTRVRVAETPPLKPPSRGMQASSSRCASMSSARTPTRTGFLVAWWLAWVFNSPSKPPSRGMQASSSHCAPMSSARTPTRVGFQDVLVCQSLACIYLFRSTDGGCVARQHRSEATGGGRRSHQRGGFSTPKPSLNSR